MSKQSKHIKRRPRVVPLGPDAECVICKAKKPLEHSHIVPQRMFYTSPNIDKPKFIDYDGINTLIMCRNHHRLYETAELDVEDFGIIWVRVMLVWLQLLDYYTELVKQGKSIPPEHIEKLRNFITKFEKYGQ